jgi:pullulanase
MRLGAAGFRLDVAEELPDEFIETLKSKVKENNEESILLGEVWEDASNKVSYNKKRRYTFGRELDSVMNYPFRNIIISFLNREISSKEFNEVAMSLYENYPREFYFGLMNFLGTHDTMRILTALKNDINKLFLASFIQMTFPGVPSIFYGDEAGLTGEKDPENRKCYPWENENLDILSFYHKFTKLRKLDIFKKGDIKFYDLNDDILAYERRYDEKSSLVMLNRNDEYIKLKLHNNKDIILKEYFTNKIYEFKDNVLDIEIEALGILVLMQN